MANKSEFKYNIHYQLHQLNNQDYEIAWSFIPERCKIAKSTFKKYVYIKGDEAKTIPGDHLLIMAVFFDCKVSELFAVPPTREEIAKQFTEYREANYPEHLYSKHLKDLQCSQSTQ